MSLLDDVSIVVTPNGYKAGELYAVVPVPTEGADLVTNGGFDTDSDWSKGTGWTISGGKANSDGTSGSNNLSQSSILLVDKRYKIEITVSNYVSGNVQVSAGASPRGTMSANGTYTFYQTCTPSTSFYIIANSFDGSVDNVSVKEYTSADMDVTRATAGTRVDEDGLVNYAEIIGSELVTCGDFSCATPSTYWTATNAVISFDNNQLTVDDTAGAGGDSRGSQSITTESGKTYRLTFNRISTTSLFYLGVGSGAGYNNIFYSSLGTDTGEYTLEFTATSSSSTIAFISGGNGITVFSNISVKEVTRDNVPRIDYTGGGCPHILAEPQRTNLVTYSEDFSQWSTARVTVLGGFTAPDGSNNAYKITNGSPDGILYLSSASDTNYTKTIYARTVSGTGTAQLLSHNANTNNTFNLTEEWQRFEVNTTTDVPTIFYAVDFRGSGTLDELLIWGAQAEDASYATSYIPTSGSTVTRNQDIFTRDGIGSLINSTEGVLFVEMAALSDDGTFRSISLSNGTPTNRVTVRYNTTSNSISAFVYQGSSTILSYNNIVTDVKDFHKLAIKYKSGDLAFWVDGIEVATSTTSFTFLPLTELDFDRGGGDRFFYGKVKQLQVYNTALTDEQLLQLTGTSGTDFYESYAEMASALTYTIQ